MGLFYAYLHRHMYMQVIWCVDPLWKRVTPQKVVIAVCNSSNTNRGQETLEL